MHTHMLEDTEHPLFPSRVLPPRTRRCVHGVGSDEIDQLILDTIEQDKTERLIPPTTKFILTTDSALVPQNIDAARIKLAEEVSHTENVSTRAQNTIETPEFWLISDIEFSEDIFNVAYGTKDIMDMSDEAYIRRHSRYEAREKKQDRREMEKLKYTQYKLRERMDQLGALKVTEFTVPGLSQKDAGELKKTMLETAENLDKRYTFQQSRLEKVPGSGVGNHPSGKDYKRNGREPSFSDEEPEKSRETAVQHTLQRSSAPACGDYVPSFSAPPASNGIPVILNAARRNAFTGRGRKRTREVEAFGVTIPPGISDYRDFALPNWVMTGWHDEEEGDAGWPDDEEEDACSV